MSPLAPVIVTAVVGVAVITSNLYSAYLARQQQLRIERHRLDPNFPLEAGPGKVRLFLRQHGFSLFSISAGLANLVFLLTRPWPLNRWDVLSIAFVVSTFFWAWTSHDHLKTRRLDQEMFTGIIDVERILQNQVKMLSEHDEHLTEIVETIVRRILDSEQR
jgi:hypothetical protein